MMGHDQRRGRDATGTDEEWEAVRRYNDAMRSVMMVAKRLHGPNVELVIKDGDDGLPFLADVRHTG